MTETQNKKTGTEKKTVFYGRYMAIACLLSGVLLLVLTPSLLFFIKQSLRTMTDDAIAPILMTFTVFISIASMILLLGGVITGALIPTRITYESSTGGDNGNEE